MQQPSVYPYTGISARTLIPSCGIEEIEQSLHDVVMDPWDALRRNLTALMDAAKDGLISGPPGVLQLEAVTDIGKSTLYRILDPRIKNPTQLDTMVKIAAAYNLQVWHLLVPRLDPLDPPEYVGSKRMRVLRSVFAQTETAAFGHEYGASGPDGRTGPAAGHGARAAGHRVHASGHPTVPVVATSPAKRRTRK